MQFPQRRFHHAALAATSNERCRRFGSLARRRAIQRRTQGVGIVGLDDPHQPLAKSKPRHDAIAGIDDAMRAQHVVVSAWRGRAGDIRRPMREERGDRFRSNLRDFVDAHGQDVRRQSRTKAGQRLDQLFAVFAIVEKDMGIGPAGCAIGLHQRPQPPHQRIRRRQGIAHRAGRA